MLAQPTQVAFNYRDLAQASHSALYHARQSSCYSLDKLLPRYLLATLTFNYCSTVATYYIASWERRIGDWNSSIANFPPSWLIWLRFVTLDIKNSQSYFVLHDPWLLIFSRSHLAICQERIDWWLKREKPTKNCFWKITIYQIKVDGLLLRDELFFYQLLQHPQFVCEFVNL